MEPLLSGGEQRRFTDRDLEYARDLGLVAMEAPIRIANPLYAEVVPRELTWVVQEELAQETAWYVAADGGLLVDKLLAAFQAFFREHSYLDRCGGEAGHLVIFDRAEGRRWADKLFHRHESAAGFPIEVWGM